MGDFNKIINQGGADINVFDGDYVELIQYGGNWYVTNIWRKDGALDATQANTFPIEGINSECIALADNQLGTMLQGLFTALCSLTNGNMYGFKAQKSASQTVVVAANSNSYSDPILFQNTNTPFFDTGNDMYQDKYVVPAAGIRQKFIVENIKLTTLLLAQGGVAVYELVLLVNGPGGYTAQGQFNSYSFSLGNGTAAGEVINIPSIVTDYLTLGEGDYVSAHVRNANGGSTVNMGFDIAIDAVLSNSF